MSDGFKACYKCQRSLALDMFSVRKLSPDGLMYECKDCRKTSAKEYRSRSTDKIKDYRSRWAKNNPESIKRSNKKYQSNNREACKAMQNRYRKENRHKLAAALMSQRAVRRGDMDRPDNCSACGLGETVHGHHEDYSKPLDVTWLCPACHMKHHKHVRDQKA